MFSLCKGAKKRKEESRQNPFVNGDIEVTQRTSLFKCLNKLLLVSSIIDG